MPSLEFERQLWCQGYSIVVGVDEVGRGAWAGPLVAAAVSWPPQILTSSELTEHIGHPMLPTTLRDSKKLSTLQRQNADRNIKSLAQFWAIGEVSVKELNRIGLTSANQLAMLRAVQKLHKAEYALIDGNLPINQLSCPQQCVIKGDSLVASIAAASIIAKVYRDAVMVDLAEQYPEYGFERHKGYGTVAHRNAVQAHGLTSVHRTIYKFKK